MVRAALVVASLLASALPAYASCEWSVDTANSRITFEATQGGEVFTGTLPPFTASITFDENDLANAKVRAVMPLTGINTGSAARDHDLPGTEWLDLSHHPEATFESNSFRQTGEHSFVADGTLTLRGVSQKLSLPFDLALEDEMALATGEVSFSRMPFGVGGNWPANSSGVGEMVKVKVTIKATCHDPLWDQPTPR